MALMLCFAGASQAQQAVPQRGYDLGVSGANLSEHILNTSNVRSSTFGQVFTLPVDDSIFAQPLYVPNVAIANQGTHNVVYVATMGDTLYAFDADVGGAPLWSVDFASIAGASPVPFDSFEFSSKNIVGNLGILSTPVIDTSSGMLYLVACTLENGTMVYRLHAVDITSGVETLGPGVVLSGRYNGVTFRARYVTQRVSLTISGNNVVFAFGSVENEYSGETIGWVMSYDKQTLSQTGIFGTNSSGNGAGVWQSGRPPVVDDSGYVFLFTGNGYSNGYDGVSRFSESALKLDPGNGLHLVDWFTPADWSSLDAQDQDLGSSGPLLIPGTELLAGGGKEGVLYLLDGNNLGKFNASDSQIVQKFTPCSYCELRTGPVYWARSNANGGPLLYNWGESDTLKAYPFYGSSLATSPSAQWAGSVPPPGGSMALSANGSTSGTGVLWATTVVSGDEEDNPPQPGELRAFDASNVSNELWNSSMNAARDAFGNLGKLVPPLVANGKVYVATWSNQVAVYGLLAGFSVSPNSLAFGNQANGVASSPSSVTVSNTSTSSLSIQISIASANPQPFTQTNNCGSSLAPGGHCTVNVVFKPAASGAVTGTLHIQTGAGTRNVTLTGTGVKPTYTLAPTSLSFGNQATSTTSAASPITLTNTSNVSLPITGISISNASPQPFSQSNNCGSSVPGGASCTINVTFAPTAAGAVTATLSVNTGAGAGTQTAALQGTGVVPTYSLSPGSLSFPVQAVGIASAASTVVLTNTSVVTVPVTAITVSSPQPFSQSNSCGTSVAAGGSCTISVVFTPTAAGAASASLNVNGGSAGTQSVSLSGTGAIPSYSLSPTSLAMGNQVVNVASAPSPVTLTNTGAVPLSIASIALSSSGTQPFSQSNNCGASLSAGGSCTINVVFDPSVVGAANATLNVSGSGVSHSVSVSGTGVFQVTLSADSQNVTATVPVVLSWSSPADAVCTASGGSSGDGWDGTLPSSGRTAVAEATSGQYTYNLDCTLQGVTASASVAVTVTMPSATLSVSPTSITLGQSVTLTWSSQDANTCTAGGGQSGGPWSSGGLTRGSTTATPTAAGNVTYSLTCLSGPKSTEVTASVTVNSSSSGGGGAFDPLSLGALLLLLAARSRGAVPSGLIVRPVNPR